MEKALGFRGGDPEGGLRVSGPLFCPWPLAGRPVGLSEDLDFEIPEVPGLGSLLLAAPGFPEPPLEDAGLVSCSVGAFTGFERVPQFRECHSVAILRPST